MGERPLWGHDLSGLFATREYTDNNTCSIFISAVHNRLARICAALVVSDISTASVLGGRRSRVSCTVLYVRTVRGTYFPAVLTAPLIIGLIHGHIAVAQDDV